MSLQEAQEYSKSKKLNENWNLEVKDCFSFLVQEVQKAHVHVRAHTHTMHETETYHLAVTLSSGRVPVLKFGCWQRGKM